MAYTNRKIRNASAETEKVRYLRKVAETGEKPRKQRIDRWIRLGLAGYVIFLGLHFAIHQYQIFRLEQQIQSVSKQYDKELEANKEMKERLKLLNQADYIEKLAREKLGLIKPGEKVYKISPGN